MSPSIRRLHPWWRAALALVLVGCAGATTAPADPPARPEARFAALGAAMTRLVAETPLRGAALVIVTRDSVLYARGFGDLGPDTPVPIASASKWLSGAVIAALAAEGTLPLDATVGRWMPSAPAAARPITVRQLFSHTSGLPGGEFTADVRCLGDRTTTLEACAGALVRLPLAAAPGTELAYGGASMQVAGRLAELASGRSWQALFEARVASPLGLVVTGFGEGANPRIAGGAVSTGREYATFLRLLLADGRWGGRELLPATAVREMERDQTAGARIVASPHAQYGASPRYGLGVWRDRVAADGAALQVSSQGALGFSPWLDRERGVAAVFVAREGLPGVYASVTELQALLRQAVDAGR